MDPKILQRIGVREMGGLFDARIDLLSEQIATNKVIWEMKILLWQQVDNNLC